MNLNDIKQQATESLKGYCRVCKLCDGKACAGEVPGMGGIGTGSSFRANLEALNKIKVNLRTIHSAKQPNTKLTLFGRQLTSPIIAAPITGTTYNMGGKLTELEFITSIVDGALAAGNLAMIGDGADPAMYDSGITALQVQNGVGIPIIKPRFQAEIIKRISKAEEIGAQAVGVDIDGAGLVTMALKGQPVGPKTAQEIRELVNSTTLPFILKGIMTPDEAEMAVAAGVAAIVVSNHGGRVLDHTPGAAEVLPAIVEKVGNRAIILVDGGIRSGLDILKLLALGAQAVLIGRPLIVGAFGGGSTGVKCVLEQLTRELEQSMILTNCSQISDINSSILYR